MKTTFHLGLGLHIAMFRRKYYVFTNIWSTIVNLALRPKLFNTGIDFILAFIFERIVDELLIIWKAFWNVDSDISGAPPGGGGKDPEKPKKMFLKNGAIFQICSVIIQNLATDLSRMEEWLEHWSRLMWIARFWNITLDLINDKGPGRSEGNWVKISIFHWDFCRYILKFSQKSSISIGF